MILVDKVSSSIKRKSILKDVSMQIREGDSIGVIGPNGAGKSTLLKVLASVLKPSSGELRFEGKPYSHNLKQVRSQIGYVPQEIALFDELKVKEQIPAWSRLASNKVDTQHVNRMVEILRLNQVMDKRTKDLSGGWKRKLNLCIGLLHEPRICLLDEPTVGIDIAAKVDILEWLQCLHQNGMTLVFISHDWYELKQLCSRMLVLDEGVKVFEGDSKHMDDLLNGEVELSQELTNIIKAGKAVNHKKP
ncbi:ABC transporter ATP-binding protein [Thalassobacillus pellis]|uniref:ABC transporter ATP-binding protein n=1 Tax=Thalassobacillus pellis TaxID=748008 RepID=UPI001961190D|nr:ABC transporter ATP-binding protein [Thalassobacillus pellis]MBM7551181.1 ABC-2 type transport system ATP-binding protein [Thalassobacillus pellis]